MSAQSKIHFINNAVLRMASKLAYRVADNAPNTFGDLQACGKELVIWSGASDKTIYGDCRVNWAFRAWHDSLHLKTGLIFHVDHEIELGRIQASLCDSQLVADLIYCEVAGQAEHYKQTGEFVTDQLSFTIKKMGF